MTVEKQRLWTILGHLTECGFTEEGFRKRHGSSLIDMSSEQRQNIAKALDEVGEYYNEVADDTLLSKYEFVGLVGYVSLIGANKKKLDITDYSNIALLIDTFKKFDIDKDDRVPIIISKHFDEMYFSNDKGRTALKQVGDIIQNDRIWTANREQHMSDLEKFLEFKEKEYASKRAKAVEKIKEYCATFDQFGIGDAYTKDMLNLLFKTKYDADLILTYLPEASVIVKDYTAIRGTNIKAMSSSLLEHFLLKDRNLTGIPNELGIYKLPDGKEINIPFTKHEFEKGIHSELFKEIHGKLR